ncbi:hypothetical protein TI39_contig5862g00001 [Zymoseptoria brevis]|uniref:Vanadium chloroperoxidase N-terminal domain-containing protein n=1 Tax=Zymoseptoria brevis TaxID=1047168 RepID=A0A0F4G7Y1_9PEZI|nr:hypothetical protein TI39_contig5862g00001 [Zymoseptoria brevis]
MEQFADDVKPFLSASALDTVQAASHPAANAAEAKLAVAGAAITVLNKLFKAPAKRDPGVSQSTATLLSDFIDASILAYQQAHGLSPRSPAYTFGAAIASLILDQLEIKGSEPGVDPYFFDDDPSHPIRVRPIDPNAPERGNKIVRPHHAPFYGTTAAVFATTEDIKIADPFTFVSDELNGVSRSLYSAYDPKLPLESQEGDVRTRVPITYNSLKEAIFANGMSRIWLGVHWHFDGFAGETV